jgi:hypothetical protein
MLLARIRLLQRIFVAQGALAIRTESSTRGPQREPGQRVRIVGGMITSTIHVLILVPVFFALMKERALRRGTLQSAESATPNELVAGD